MKKIQTNNDVIDCNCIRPRGRIFWSTAEAKVSYFPKMMTKAVAKGTLGDKNLDDDARGGSLLSLFSLAKRTSYLDECSGLDRTSTNQREVWSWEHEKLFFRFIA